MTTGDGCVVLLHDSVAHGGALLLLAAPVVSASMAGGVDNGERTLTAPMPDPKAPKAKRGRPPRLDRMVMPRLRSAYDALSLPVLVLFLFYNRRIDRNYGMSWPARLKLALRMWRNTRRIPTGTSYKAHLAMAVKLLETPPTAKGVVVECGCWQGGSTVNLSLICDIVGRRLVVYDSFEGLPPAEPNDRYSAPMARGITQGTSIR